MIFFYNHKFLLNLENENNFFCDPLEDKIVSMPGAPKFAEQLSGAMSTHVSKL
jgi:hypothetical protein